MNPLVSAEIADHSEMNDYGFECFSFHYDGFRKLTGPGVYMAITGSGESLKVLYIGSAKNVLARISEPLHASLREALSDKDCRLMVAICKSEQHARAVEADLIRDCDPILNIVGKPRIFNG